MKPLHDYARACDDLLAECRGDDTVKISAVAADSRQVQPGALFVAINGAQVDGRAFIPQAAARGAAAVLCQGPLPAGVDLPHLRVTDDYAAAARVAECCHDYPAAGMYTIGITGTNGKTTTAFLVEHLLRAAGRQTGMIGTVHYKVGDAVRTADRTTPTPFELQAMIADMRAAGADTLVMEVSSHALCQQRLGTTRCDLAVFTNLSPEHLDYHEDMEQYYHAKKRLFTDVLAADGTAVINIDCPYGKRLAAELAEADVHTCTCGRAAAADVRIQHQRMDLTGTHLALPEGELHSPLIGDYNADNAVAAVACARRAGIPFDRVRRALAAFAGVPGRLQSAAAERVANVFIDYAHTADALENVLDCLRPLCRGRLLVVFGCGGDRDRTKRPEMGRVAAERADLLVVTSDNPRTEDPNAIIREICAGIPDTAEAIVEPDRYQAICRALAAKADADTLLIAGKGHEDYQEVNGVKHAFSDLDAVARALG